MAYAVDTKVPVSQTQGEIRTLVNKNGADRFAVVEERARVQIAFQMRDRNIRFSIPMPERKPGESTAEANRREKVSRSRWRALLLVLKAKFESIEANIETFEQSFLAHVQMPSGRTVYEELKAPIALEYQNPTGVPLLEGPRT